MFQWMRILGLLQLTCLLYYVRAYDLVPTVIESNGSLFAHTRDTSTLYPLVWASTITDTDTDTNTDTRFEASNSTNSALILVPSIGTGHKESRDINTDACVSASLTERSIDYQ